MDCERFDQVVLDWLYEELDEIEGSATQRHLAHCTRCRKIASQLRAAREVGLVPSQPPSETLHGRILDAERSAHASLPLRKRLGRGVSVLAGWTMRPQLAMGALLLLMIGASLVFLRARPGEGDSSGITERGVPEHPEQAVNVQAMEPVRRDLPTAEDSAGESELHPRNSDESAARERGEVDRDDSPARLTDAGAPALPELDESSAKERFESAVTRFRSGAFADARTEFSLLAATKLSIAPDAELFAARSLEHEQGCLAAIPEYERLQRKLKTETLALEANWLAAECERKLKRWASARARYETLRTSPSYGARADQALRALKRASATPDAGATPSSTVVPAAPSADASAPRIP